MEIIFGPVPSRRLGRSLGVSLVPDKICNFDCVYCEIGRTKAYSINRKPYISADKVLEAFTKAYEELKDKIDVITITGAGEPTLNSDLYEIARRIKAVAKHPMVILTNSSTINDPEVVKSLMLFDIVVPSVDAVEQATFEKVDKPAPNIDINRVIDGIAEFSQKFTGKIFIELLLVKGMNDSQEDLEKFVGAVKKIRHDKIQVGTVFRPPSWECSEKLSEEELGNAYLFLKGKGLNVEPVGRFAAKNLEIDELNNKAAVISLLTLRPVTLADISAGLGISTEKVAEILSEIEKEKKLLRLEHSGEEYFSLSKR